MRFTGQGTGTVHRHFRTSKNRSPDGFDKIRPKSTPEPRDSIYWLLRLEPTLKVRILKGIITESSPSA